MYVIVRFTPKDDAELRFIGNHFDAGYQYNLLASDENGACFLFKVEDDVTVSALILDPIDNNFSTSEKTLVLATNSEPYSGHEDFDKEEDEGVSR